MVGHAPNARRLPISRFHAFLVGVGYRAAMDQLCAVAGELICVRPDAMPVVRRRLLVERLTDGADRFAVKVTSLRSESCVLSGPPSLEQVAGKLWLKLPGFEAFQLAAIAEEEGKLICWFAQPLQTAMVEAIVRPRRPVITHSSFKPRCTLFR
jgi:hypothetical protein